MTLYQLLCSLNYHPIDVLNYRSTTTLTSSPLQSLLEVQNRIQHPLLTTTKVVRTVVSLVCPHILVKCTMISKDDIFPNRDEVRSLRCIKLMFCNFFLGLTDCQPVNIWVCWKGCSPRSDERMDTYIHDTRTCTTTSTKPILTYTRKLVQPKNCVTVKSRNFKGSGSSSQGKF